MNKQYSKKDKIKLKITKLKPGMKIANDLDHEFGGIILPAGTILDKNKISRLDRLGFRSVQVFNENKDKRKKSVNNINKYEVKYRQIIDRMGAVFKRIRKIKKINYDDVKNLTHDVISLGNDKEMINLLTKVRNTDRYTYAHLLNVGILAYMFGNWLGFEKNKCFQLTQAGLLHDLGKAYISDEILNKPTKLTKNEFEQMKKHTIYGYAMVNKADHISERTAQGILTHHERYDGKGYPMGIKGEKIPLFGRILAIIDTYDALTAERTYQTRMSPFKALKLLKEEIFANYDYQLLKIFLTKMPNYFVNEKVILNNGKKAEVVFINPQLHGSLIIKMDGNYIDLYKNDSIEIDHLVTG